MNFLFFVLLVLLVFFVWAINQCSEKVELQRENKELKKELAAVIDRFITSLDEYERWKIARLIGGDLSEDIEECLAEGAADD